jgi:hypothetical protein
MIMSSEVKGYATFGSLRNSLHKVLADQGGEVVAIGLTRARA